jgi:hypothetical protein
MSDPSSHIQTWLEQIRVLAEEIGPHGEAPYWHRIEDTFDKMDGQAMQRNYTFTWEFIQRLNAG